MDGFEKLKLKITLMAAKTDILKLKADDYNWQCHTPQNVKDELEAMLVEINQGLQDLSEIR